MVEFRSKETCVDVVGPALDEPPGPVGEAVVIRESVHVSGRMDSTNLDVLAAALSKAARRPRTASRTLVSPAAGLTHRQECAVMLR